MKILIYNDFKSHVGGVETFVHEISQGLRASQIDVKNVSFLNEPHHRQAFVDKVTAVFRRHLPYPNVAQRFHEIIESYKPDLIHLQNIKYYSQGILSAVARHDIPVISSFHDHHLISEQSMVNTSIKQYLKNKLLNHIRKVSSAMTCHSMRMKNLLEKRGFNRVTYIPYFVDLEKWSFNPSAHRNPNQFSFLGRIHADKGIFVWVEAVRQLIHKIPNLELICMGDGREKAQLQKLVLKDGLEDHIKIIGHQDVSAIRRYFHSSRALIFPSVFEEMFGIAGIEAQATGLPVIASDVGGIPEWCQHQKTGILVAPNQPEELANAMRWTLENPTKCQLIASRARAAVEQKHNKIDSINKLMNVYQETIELKSSRVFVRPAAVYATAV